MGLDAEVKGQIFRGVFQMNVALGDGRPDLIHPGINGRNPAQGFHTFVQKRLLMGFFHIKPEVNIRVFIHPAKPVRALQPHGVDIGFLHAEIFQIGNDFVTLHP